MCNRSFLNSHLSRTGWGSRHKKCIYRRHPGYGQRFILNNFFERRNIRCCYLLFLGVKNENLAKRRRAPRGPAELPAIWRKMNIHARAHLNKPWKSVILLLVCYNMLEGQAWIRSLNGKTVVHWQTKSGLRVWKGVCIFFPVFQRSCSSSSKPHKMHSSKKCTKFDPKCIWPLYMKFEKNGVSVRSNTDGFFHHAS